MKDAKLDGAVDLFVQSQRRSYDNLRAFIAAWSPLELLVNRLARAYQAQFGALLDGGTALPAWDKDLAYQLRLLDLPVRLCGCTSTVTKSSADSATR
jgi:hypothetical protein